MKKFLGWLLIVSGVGNLITMLARLFLDASQVGGHDNGGRFIFGIVFIGIGMWLIRSKTTK